MGNQSIHIRGLQIETRIGVPDEERAETQTLKVDLEITPKVAFRDLNDEVEKTVDYHAVSQDIERLARIGERHLIETLAEEISDLVLTGYPAVGVTVRIRKFILPQTEWVGVELSKRSQ